MSSFVLGHWARFAFLLSEFYSSESETPPVLNTDVADKRYLTTSAVLVTRAIVEEGEELHSEMERTQ